MAAATVTEQVAPIEQTEVKAVVTPIAPAEKQEPQQPVAKAGQQHQAALAVVLRAAKRFNVEARFESLRRYYEKVRSFVWYWIEELLEEFQPWLKWIIFDAVLTLVIGQLVKYFEGLRPLFEAVGWA
ncbi:hypothetical protein OEZ85_012323 [Tetradesmus obliquus]|uniref:Uncharacterized protein n=1 Tax=Tetradesmus obliquus TaxID=3088 RepID=A0ABY8TXR5_TETOB|nr:hypothetical protein OEZ85_012323 [Tetradesmus obliquus]